MNTNPSVKRSISKIIGAPAEKVFDSWLIPAVVGRWMFDPSVQPGKVLELRNNVRPRGDFTFKVTRAGKEVVITGVYQVIDRPRQLEFTWLEDNGAATVVTVLLESYQDRTRMRVSLKLDAALANHADNIKQLWSARSALLAELLSKKA